MEEVDEDRGSKHKVVLLNFGGMKFVTSWDTLTIGKGETFFKALLNGKIPSFQDEKGYYFIDRNGRYFEPILDFLRTGILYIPSNMSRKLVEELAGFLMIDIGKASITVSQEELLQYVNAMGQNGLQLPCYTLERLSFSRLNLSGSNFADVSESDFSYANLKYANFINAVLENADLSYTCLDYASLRNANLKDCNLSNCTLANASFSGANLTGAICQDLSMPSLYCSKCGRKITPSKCTKCYKCGDESDVLAYNL